MWLQKTLNWFDKINRFLVALLKYIAIWILAAMMFLTAVDVFLRYIFNSPITGSFELVEYMMAVIVPLSIVFCAHQRSHINVDLIIERFPAGTRSVLAFIMNLLSLGLFLLITWQTFLYIGEEYDSKLTSAVLYIPVYPFIAALAMAFAILCLLLIFELLNYLSKNFMRWNRS